MSKQISGSSVAILWCFRIVIAIQCVGVAGRYLLSPYESESDIFGYLFFDIGWPEQLAQWIDDAGAVGCLLSAVGLTVAGFLSPRASGNQPQGRARVVTNYLENAALIFVSTWSFLLPAAHSVRGELYAEFALGEQAVRFATPLAMLLFLRSVTVSSKTLANAACVILTLATAATFIVHGYIAQKMYGPFVDLILLTDMRLFQFGVEQSTVETLLYVIGWADIVVGVLLLVTRWKVIAVYMVCWGLITASSRISAHGVVDWPETMIRAANAGAPLLLVLLYQNSRSSKPRT